MLEVARFYIDVCLTDVDVQGCTFVVASFAQYFVNRSRVIQLLIEAIGKCLEFSIAHVGLDDILCC